MADKFSDYYYLPVKARARIDGNEVPLTNFSVSYSLNEVPEAEVGIAVGRQAMGSQIGQISSGHGVLTNLAPFTPIEVELRVDAEPAGRSAPKGKSTGVPLGKWFKVFDGFLKTPATVKSPASGTTTLTFKAFGTPGALAGSTSLITGVTVSSPQHGSGEIIVRLGESKGATVRDALAGKLDDSFLNDIWTGMILPVFREIADQTDVWSKAARDTETLNSFAKVALDRMNTGVVSAGVPTMNMGKFVDSSFYQMFSPAVFKYLVDVIFGAWAAGVLPRLGGDLWDITLMMAKDLLFDFVPAIDFDALVPITKGLGGEPWLIVGPDEYWAESVTKQMDPKFYAYVTTVGIYQTSYHDSPWQSDATSMGSFGAATVSQSLLPGAQASFGETPRGRIELIEAPAWMVIAGPPPNDSLRTGGAIPDASNPDSTGEPTVNPGKGGTRYFSSGMGDAVAKYYLMQKLFEHRLMSFAGRLRVDMAPGSLIRVDTVGERFSGQEDTLFGHVERVTLVVAADASMARTEVYLSNVRSEKEHETLTTDLHPFYEVAWNGSALTTEFS